MNYTYFWINWKEHRVQMEFLQGTQLVMCHQDEHDIEIMYHLEENETHSRPTGFLRCITCCAIGQEPEPFEYELVGEKFYESSN